jgi:hypothetical protein
MSLRVRGHKRELGERGQAAIYWERERDIWHARELASTDPSRPGICQAHRPSQSARTRISTAFFSQALDAEGVPWSGAQGPIRLPFTPAASPMCPLLIYVPCACSGSPCDPGWDPGPAASLHGFVCLLACVVCGVFIGARKRTRHEFWKSELPAVGFSFLMCRSGAFTSSAPGTPTCCLSPFLQGYQCNAQTRQNLWVSVSNNALI